MQPMHKHITNKSKYDNRLLPSSNTPKKSQVSIILVCLMYRTNLRLVRRHAKSA